MPCSKQSSHLSPPPRQASGTGHREGGPGGYAQSVSSSTSAPQEMAYFMKTLCLGLVHKTTWEATEQSPLEGRLCLALWHCFQWKLVLAVFSFTLKLQLALSPLTYYNCNAVHSVKVTPVFIHHMPSKYREENTMWSLSEDQKRRGEAGFTPHAGHTVLLEQWTRLSDYSGLLPRPARTVYWQRNKQAPVRFQDD